MAVKTIMTAEDIRRTLARMAHEIIERHQELDRLVLVGIHTRGVPIAQRLADNIAKFEGVRVPVGTLDFSRHRDDLNSLEAPPRPRRTDIPADIDGKSIILADDVLYTGRSIRAAMDALIELGRPSLIQLAVLIDRGHREMPVRADYVGKNMPSARHEDIRVRVVEIDSIDDVAIISDDNDRNHREAGIKSGSLPRGNHESGK